MCMNISSRQECIHEPSNPCPPQALHDQAVRPRGRAKTQDAKKLTQWRDRAQRPGEGYFCRQPGARDPARRGRDRQALFGVPHAGPRALLQLIEAGLVEKPSRQRAVVAPLDVRRLIQMFETLSELEAICARLATRRITPQERETLS